MESIEERYYLYSNDSNFTDIHYNKRKLLPSSTTDIKAKFAGKIFAEDKNLKTWWVEKETIKTIKTVRRLT